MCGICGSSGSAGRERVSRLNLLQRQRGPDRVCVGQVDGFVLGNTRLAIIDRTRAGEQPLVSADGSIVCVFNGEIYNYRELIRDHQLDMRGGSDGAVIPELYCRYGKAGLRLLRGMFAVAIYDGRRRRLVLARDPFGIKPLFWCCQSEGVSFASSGRALASVLGLTTISPGAVTDFLRFGHLQAGTSPFVGLRSVAPNEWVEFDETSVQGSGLVHDELLRETHTASDGLADSLRQSVGLHLRSDVSTALLLSSGVDSASLAWAASDCGVSLDCYTVDLGEGRSEAEAAASLARRFGHRHVVVRRELTKEDVRNFIREMSCPSIDGLNTYLVCRSVAEHGVKVALSGIGGDEALAGYRHFRWLRLLGALKLLDRLPKWAHGRIVRMVPPIGPLASEKVQELLGCDGPRDAAGVSRLHRRLFDDRHVRALTGSMPPANESRSSDYGRSRDLSIAELRGYLQGMLLPDADTYSMASSVELRVPFVDIEFMRVALAVDPERGVGKRRFAEALADPMIRQCASAPKQGFGLPMSKWMDSGVLAPWVAELQDPVAPLWQHVDQDAARLVFDRWHRGGRWSEVWALAVLNAWLTELPVPYSREKQNDVSCAG